MCVSSTKKNSKTKMQREIFVTRHGYTLIFLLIVFNKGTKLVGEQDNVDNCQKTQTVVSPIKLNIDQKQKQQKASLSMTFGHSFLLKIKNKNENK